MTTFTEYREQSDTNAWLSPAIWAPLNLNHEFFTGKLQFFFEDWHGFHDWPAKATSAGAVNDGASTTAPTMWEAFQDVGTAADVLATTHTGVLQISGNDADNDQFFLASSQDVCGNWVATAGKAAAFECRFKTASVGDNGCALAIGMAEEGIAADNALVDNTGALVDKDFIGFNTLAADGDALRASYNTASGGGISTANAAAATLAAATWTKVGFYIDPSASTCTYYVNGTPVPSPVALTATNFPNGEEMVACFLTKVGTAAEVLVDIDWIAWCCEK